LADPVAKPQESLIGDANQTVQVLVYTAKGNLGFRVIGRIKIVGYCATRTREHGPEIHGDKPWPADIDGEARRYHLGCIEAGERHVERQGYSAARLVTCFDSLMAAKEAGTLGQRPKLVAVYGWLQSIKAKAAEQEKNFDKAPHTFEDVLTESMQG
jgi:hypothetical protein